MNASRLPWKFLPVFPPLGVATYYTIEDRPLVVLAWILAVVAYGSLFVPGLWKRVGGTLVNALRHTRAYLSRVGHVGATTAASGGKSLLHGVENALETAWQNFKENSWLWLGVAASIAALCLFGRAYSEQDSHLLHLGLLLASASVVFLITHFNGWGKIKEMVAAHPVRFWIALSVLSLVVTLGHAIILRGDITWWYLALVSLISLIMATITVVDGWGTLGELMSEGVSKIIGLLFAEKGWAAMLLAWSAVFFVIAVTLMATWVYVGLNEDLRHLMAFTTAASLILLLASAGVALKSGTDRFGKAVGFTD